MPRPNKHTKIVPLVAQMLEQGKGYQEVLDAFPTVPASSLYGIMKRVGYVPKRRNTRRPDEAFRALPEEAWATVCPHCDGKELVFETDGNGRTYERCTNRECGHVVRLTSARRLQAS